ncbi:MAG: ChaN family lipoprotein [Gammaproteobacteria bacterium]|nr:ChaN family lipoprotein [Gammaproteobacteria bacterium]MBU1416128.1 ChaN family lipoprotein [Gammaproteobacteria bacterium]
MAGQQVVLLGESHDSAEDHRWQLQTLTALYARQPKIAIAFEMFPRRIQPVLDDWVAGRLSEQEFLDRSEWDKVWGFDARDYLPLFHFARMNRLPMLAANVERSLPEAVGKVGWDKVPDAQKEGVSRPAAPGEEYLKDLRMAFEHHPDKEKDGEAAFARFVEAQTLWDRAIAQRIAEHLTQHPDSLVVGILGAGHVRHGRGVAFQLRDFTVKRVGTLLTWDQSDDCAHIAEGLADAVQIVAPPKASPPRLGIASDDVGGGKSGVRIVSVVAGSVAEQAGLKAGDVLLEIAGRPVKNFFTVRAAVQRQPPGTWLPIKVKRDEKEIEVVARFPAEK